MPSRVDRELVAAKLMLIRENVEQLLKLARLPRARFLGDPVRRAAAERLLHVAIEAAIDICSHIISARNLRKPERYADIPLILKEAGVLRGDVADSFLSMVRFRKLLVRLYARVDIDKLYNILRIT